MISYIGQKRNHKIIDTFRSLSETSLSLNACVKKLDTITLGKKQSADMTEEENEALGRIVDRIFRCVASIGIDTELLRMADEGHGRRMELVEQEVLCEQFMEARKMPEPKRKHDRGECEMNDICPTAHGVGDDDCVLN